MKRSTFVGLFVLVLFLSIQVGCAHSLKGAGDLMQGIGKDVSSWGEPQRNDYEEYRRMRETRSTSY